MWGLDDDFVRLAASQTIQFVKQESNTFGTQTIFRQTKWRRHEVTHSKTGVKWTPWATLLSTFYVLVTVSTQQNIGARMDAHSALWPLMRWC